MHQHICEQWRIPSSIPALGLAIALEAIVFMGGHDAVSVHIQGRHPVEASPGFFFLWVSWILLYIGLLDSSLHGSDAAMAVEA